MRCCSRTKNNTRNSYNARAEVWRHRPEPSLSSHTSKGEDRVALGAPKSTHTPRTTALSPFPPSSRGKPFYAHVRNVACGTLVRVGCGAINGAASTRDASEHRQSPLYPSPSFAHPHRSSFTSRSFVTVDEVGVMYMRFHPQL